MFQETVAQPLAREAAALNLEMAELAETALRVKAERDEAIELLKRTLLLREMGQYGEHKDSIRQFLRRVVRLPEGA